MVMNDELRLACLREIFLGSDDIKMYRTSSGDFAVGRSCLVCGIIVADKALVLPVFLKTVNAAVCGDCIVSAANSVPDVRVPEDVVTCVTNDIRSVINTLKEPVKIPPIKKTPKYGSCLA